MGFQLALSPLLLVPLAVGAKEVSGAEKNPSSAREEWEGVLVFVVIPRRVVNREVVKRRKVIRRNKERPR